MMKRPDISPRGHRRTIALSLAVALLAAGAPAHAFMQREGGLREGGQREGGPPMASGGRGGPGALARPHGREISDQEHARHQRESGQNRSFDELFRRASAIGRGEYLGVEPDISRNIYRFKFMRPSGNVVWVDMDGRTGRELAVRQ